MGKLKEKYADEIIHELEKVKHGAWVDWIDKCSKDAVIEICQNVIEDWCGRSIDHVQPCPKEPKKQQTAEDYQIYKSITNGSEYMRDATAEEQKSTSDYIKSISKPTGVNFEDCISRAEVIKIIEEELPIYTGDYRYGMKERVCELPSCPNLSNQCQNVLEDYIRTSPCDSCMDSVPLVSKIKEV